ncbi:citrate lyase holo-[acyl-carrier protein] synthase [Proteiniclasticum sp. SCR006]|uniref:citrate lyase holo-[acyl-carrier protein] synthase n=1 Tax=Proteiniclasticum aestuarii TaxID=2817862 RepID=A0A939KJ01_9CLOT|nr:citrate lyase holo-[acyl-carrier protein] synthase [Proteiniclasticum aestuarii]MBO1264526.1 citrate lyase holo-[acyl-carrier protein] synthase [Proteiniclasticum aestuarii]
MKKNPLAEGSSPSLEEVLHTRENRVRFQEALAAEYAPDSVISFKLNIPGPVKSNETIGKIFSLGKSDITDAIAAEGWEILYEKIMDLKTGPELFLVTRGTLAEVKSAMIRLEEEMPLGRLFDLDVFAAEGTVVRTLSREALGYPERRCLICEKPAKVCGRNRTHEIREMHEKIMEILEKENRLK